MPLSEKYLACGSNWEIDPPVHPPPKKKTMAGKPFSAGSACGR